MGGVEVLSVKESNCVRPFGGKTIEEGNESNIGLV